MHLFPCFRKCSSQFESFNYCVEEEKESKVFLEMVDFPAHSWKEFRMPLTFGVVAYQRLL